MTVETVTVDLPCLLVECEGLLAPRARTKELAFSVLLDTPIPRRAVTDPTRLRQMILNLAGNAIKFTDEGHVTLRVAIPNPTEIVQTLRIDVEDTGQGLSVDQAARIFQPFMQADTSVTRTHGGTGLGLSISRRLAGLLGGDVTLVRSAIGTGSVFRLEIEIIPSGDDDAVSTLHDEANGSPGATGFVPIDTAVHLAGRILVAEDNPVNQRLLEVLLAKAGATVEVADDGAKALARIEAAVEAATPYDVLITDMQMPVMDGYTLVRTLRARGLGIPAIALTAHAMSEDRKRCLDVGCDEYATKPIDFPGLLRICARWIDAGRSNAPSHTLSLVEPGVTRATDHVPAEESLRHTA